MKQICLYLKKNMDIDGEVEDKPIANSLKELINNMNVVVKFFDRKSK